MINLKKEVIILGIFLLLISSSSVFADDVGCCINPGAGQLACSADRLILRDHECCPTPENNFPSYYKSAQNPGNPNSSNECITNFFFSEKSCANVDACALGCCCSQSGGTITSGPQCTGTGLVFHKGETNCDQICPQQCPPEGCSNGTRTSDCNNPNFSPKLSNLEITSVKGQQKFSLKWQDECAQAASYEVLRCQGIDCTNFAVIGAANTNSFEDASGDLLFDTDYTYQVKAHYNLQSATPTIKKTALLGNLECLGQFSSNNFCIQNSYYDQYMGYLSGNFPDIFGNFSDGVKNSFGNRLNKAFFCDSVNNLIPEGTACSSTQVCAVNNNRPSCINKINCNYAGANPFGLFYTLADCENNKYCFYDRSKTIVNSCFNCDPSMSCYDYKTEEACTRDNCKVGSCKWKNLVTQIGVGACVSTVQYNCQWCSSKGTGSLENARAFNNVFDICTNEKSSALSEGQFKCYFKDGISKSCEDVVCTDYSHEQCSNAGIKHDENNKITNPSQDECGIKVCQNINSICAKNADGDDKADCSDKLCESDYFPPVTTLLPVVKKAITDSLIVQIYDKTSLNSPNTLRESTDYATFLCTEPCGANGHPYNSSTTSRKIVLSNLNAYDGDNGNKLLTLNEGANTLRYYSQDPSRNIGEIKTITLEAHSNSSGPKVFSINVTDGARVLDKIYTSNQHPNIDIHFFEPAIVTFARIVNKNATKITNLNGNTEISATVSMQVPETLANGDYTLELNAKNKNNIFMDSPVSQAIIIDNNKPLVNITPPNGLTLNTSNVTVTLAFNKEVNLNYIKINSEDFTSMFSTMDNRIFTAAINLPDGNKNLQVAASDFAKNQVASSVSFIIYSHTNTISLVNPKFAISSTFIFDIVAETDNNAVCRHSIDNNFEYDFMESFTTSGATMHTITGFSKIASGDTNAHKLYIKCKDAQGQFSNAFDISVDTTPPQIKTAFAFPNPVIEKPPITTLTLESDEPAICKFSSSPKEFGQMEGKFDGFDNNTFKIINRQQINLENEGNFSYYAACQNKAGLNSGVKTISFNVDSSVPISIISHTPDFFNSTNAVLAIETNKKAQCKFSESDPTVQIGEIFGQPGYSHTRQLATSPGKHTFYIVCKDQFLQKFSGVASVSFTVDVTPPEMLFVDDSSTFVQFPQKTCLSDRLRVKFLGQDNESNVKDYFYSILRKLDNQIILNYTQTFIGDDWIIVGNLNLSDNTQYSFSAKARNFVDLESTPKNSDGITVDTSACTSKPSCGDGAINQAGEECDKGTFGLINSCTKYQNYIAGTLKCTSDCKLDPSGCIARQPCGNGELDPGEACDGTDLGLPTSNCADYNPSFSGGVISCTNDCQFDTSKCQGTQGACGDGKINIGEACDGSVLGSLKSCADYSQSFTAGTLKCTSDCKLDTSGCTKAQMCGNGKLNTGELCDGTNFGTINNLNCNSYSPNFVNGTLKCNSCKISTDDCNSNTVQITCKDRGDCKIGDLCSGNSDCESRFCSNGRCAQPSCNDGVKNQDESDADCGGICNKCSNDKPCKINSDCQSSYCMFGFCKPQESCADGKLTPGESDIDCGGHCPTKCPEGGSCGTNDDCRESMRCVSSQCKKAAEPGKQACNVGGTADSDCDGMPDDWEIQNALNPNDPNDASQDNDKDGLTNLQEYQVVNTKWGKSANPNKADTDGDGFTDKQEIDAGTDPLDPKDIPKSNKGKLVIFILGAIVLASGFGYLAYNMAIKRKEQKFSLPKQREVQIITPQQPARQVQQKQKEGDLKIREAIKEREEQKEKERKKLFEPFGKPEEKQRETPKEEKKATAGQKPSLSKEPKGEKQKKQPKTEDKIERLYKLAKSKTKKKISKTKDF